MSNSFGSKIIFKMCNNNVTYSNIDHNSYFLNSTVIANIICEIYKSELKEKDMCIGCPNKMYIHFIPICFYK